MPDPTATSRFLDLYRGIFENCADGVILGTTHGTILAANPVACRLLGSTEAEIVRSGRAGVTVDDEAFRAFLGTRVREGIARGAMHFRRTDGGTILCDVTSAVVPGFEGESFAYVIFRDATESSRVRQKVEASEKRLREVLDASTDGFWEHDITAQRLRLSARTSEILGLPAHDSTVDERDFLGRIHPDDRGSGVRIYTAMVEGSIERFDSEYRIRDEVSAWRWVRSRGKVITRTESGAALRVAGTLSDVHARKVAEEALRAREAKLRAFFDTPAVGIAITEGDVQFAEVNDRFCAMLGYDRGELAELTWPEVTHPDDAALDLAQVRRMAAGELDSFAREKRYVRKDGSILWSLTSVSCSRADDGSIRWIIAIAKDISGRKRAEEDVRTSEARLARVLEGSADGYYEIDGATRQIALSPRYAEIMGLPPGTTEISLHDVMARLAPGDLPWIGRDIAAIRSGAIERFDWEHRIRAPDGSFRWVHARGKVIERRPDGGAARISGTVSDIQARKVADEALRASEARFRSLAEDAPVGIFEASADGRGIYMNASAARMTFLPGVGAVGSAWEQNLHPEDRARVLREWYEAARAGRPVHLECRFQGRDGAVTRVQVHARPVHGAAGRLTGYMGVLLDVTEERALAASLAVNSRLAALGTLVAGVAHEVNNPLAGSLASQGVAAEELRELRSTLASASPPGREEVDRRLAAVLDALGDALSSDQRIARIVRDLNVFAKPDPGRSPVRIGEVVEEALRWLNVSVAANASIRVDLKEVPPVMASSGQLQQVIVNLVTNAAKSIPAGRRGKVTIRVGPGEPGMARVEVQDDGAGMSPEVMQRMFDPFYTTRTVGQGMGLGLPVCHAIVTAHGGTITATSEPGAGSVFRVELPVAGDG